MKKTLTFILFVFILYSSGLTQSHDDLQLKRIDNYRLKLFPVPDDGRNYFFLLSVDDITQIVIGDFMQGEKRIILINLGSDYNTIKSVTEYYPRSRKLITRKDSTSKFFTTDVSRLKKEIISGTIFKNNSADDMKSFNELESVFRENDAGRVFPNVYGYNVKLTEIDELNR